MLAPTTTAAATWPIAGDVPDLQQIVRAQAITVADQFALISAYQAVLASAQAPAGVATGVGGAAGVNLTMASVTTGTIALGSTVAGAGMVAGTVVLAQTAGTPGGAGAYTLSQGSTTATGTTLTFTPSTSGMSWPTPTDAPDLMLIAQDQTALIRMQTAMLQTYQNLLNDSQTVPPPTGP